MVVDIKILAEIMEQIREYEYPKSKQIAQFIADVLDHFGEERKGSAE